MQMRMNCNIIIFHLGYYVVISLTIFKNYLYFRHLGSIAMKFKALILGFCLLLPISGFAEGEKVMVDKEEYEQLKAAVKFLMGEREENKKAVEDAKAAAEEAAASARVANENAEEATEVAEAAAEAAESPILQGLENVSIGGYGEVHYNNYKADDDDATPFGGEDNFDDLDLHRFVLFFGYQFTENLRFYSEFEIEHGGVEDDGDPLGGEVEVEQAFVEWDFAENTSVLGGVFLIPVGILNETHEPDTFYGVERNNVENVITPATWWAAGAMLTHRFDSGIKLEVAVHEGLEIPVGDDMDFNDSDFRVRSGRQKTSNADASHLAYTGAVTYTGIQGLEVGATIQHQDDASQSGGDGLEDGLLLAGHIAYERGMFGLRAYYAEWDFDGDLVEAQDDDDQHGWYIEPSIKPFGDKIGFFLRYEEVEGGRDRDEFEQWNLGFNYWLHENVVIKADYIDREHDVEAEEDRDFDGYNIGVGWSW